MKALDQSVISRAELLARSHELQTVADLMGLHPSQITRMKNRGWKAACSGRPLRSIPSDFAIMQSRLKFTDLTKYYRAGNTTIMRWMAETPNPRPSFKGRNLTKTARNARQGCRA